MRDGKGRGKIGDEERKVMEFLSFVRVLKVIKSNLYENLK